MKLSQAIIAVTVLASTAFNANADAGCGDKNSRSKINGFNTWTSGKAVVFSTPHLNVDADGAPNSYLLDGRGLSYTCDGVLAIENGRRITPENNRKEWQRKCNEAWLTAKSTNDYRGVAIFGFLTDKKNNPIVQGEGDPLPGLAYITTTSVHIPGTKEGTQKHEVDATAIPYVVLPSAFISKYNVKPGDIAVVYRAKTKKYAFGVYADGGKLGEASVKLHEDIGNNPIIIKNGVKRAKVSIDDPVITVVFPGITTHPNTDTIKWLEEIKAIGNKVLEQFGGENQLMTCAN
jgi:hypothetical protein